MSEITMNTVLKCIYNKCDNSYNCFYYILNYALNRVKINRRDNNKKSSYRALLLLISTNIINKKNIKGTIIALDNASSLGIYINKYLDDLLFTDRQSDDIMKEINNIEHDISSKPLCVLEKAKL